MTFERQILKAIRETNSYRMSNYKAMKIESLDQVAPNKYEVAISFRAKKFYDNIAIYSLTVHETRINPNKSEYSLTAYFEEEKYTHKA